MNQRAYIDGSGRWSLQITGDDETKRKILGFRALPVGWYYGEGCPPAERIVRAAVDVNDEALSAGFTETDAFPGIDGEVRVTVYHGADYLEFTVETNGRVTYLREHGDKEIDFRENLTPAKARALIRRNAKQLCPLSGSSSLSTLIEQSSDFKALPFATQAAQEEQEFQSSTPNASMRREPVSAPIYGDTMRMDFATRLSSG